MPPAGHAPRWDPALTDLLARACACANLAGFCIHGPCAQFQNTMNHFWATLPTRMLPLLDLEVVLVYVRDCDTIFYSVRRQAPPKRPHPHQARLTPRWCSIVRVCGGARA